MNIRKQNYAKHTSNSGVEYLALSPTGFHNNNSNGTSQTPPPSSLSPLFKSLPGRTKVKFLSRKEKRFLPKATLTNTNTPMHQIIPFPTC